MPALGGAAVTARSGLEMLVQLAIADAACIVVLPLVAWCTATVESHRLRLLGIPYPGPLPSGSMRHPWDPGGLKEGNLAVWGVAVLFAIVDLLPGLMLAGLYLVYVVIRAVLQPSVAPKPRDEDIGDVPIGNRTALQLVTDGLKATPIDPSFTDARDALIDADWGRISDSASAVFDMITGACFSYNFSEGRYQPNYALFAGLGALAFGLGLISLGLLGYRRKLGRRPVHAH